MVREPERRKEKFEAKVDPETLRRQTEKLKPGMVKHEAAYFQDIATVEKKVKDLVESQGVTALEVRDYLNFGREMYELSKRFRGATLAAEAQIRVDKWSARGLLGDLLIKIAQFFGVTPSAAPVPPLEEKIDDIEEKLDLIGPKVDALETKLDTIGLDVTALEVKLDLIGLLVPDIEDKLDEMGLEVDALEVKLDAVKTDVDNIQIPIRFSSAEAMDAIASASATDTTEKAITVSLPAGSSIVRAMLAAFITAMNNAEAAQKIDIDVKGRPQGGSWSTFFSQDDVIGFPAADGATTGLVPLQNVSALVTAAGTYGFKLTVQASAASSIRYTTQYLLIVTYRMS